MLREKSLFLNANQVADYMSISMPMAYKVIRKLNDEMKKDGYITISGKVNRCYFESKIFGGIQKAESNNACL